MRASCYEDDPHVHNEIIPCRMICTYILLEAKNICLTVSSFANTIVMISYKRTKIVYKASPKEP